MTTNPAPDFKLKPTDKDLKRLIDADTSVKRTRDKIKTWEAKEQIVIDKLQQDITAKIRALRAANTKLNQRTRRIPRKIANLNISLGRRIEFIRGREFDRLRTAAARRFSMKMMKEGLKVV